MEEGAQVRLGESWTSGAVVLSWNDVLRGASDIGDGRNVVLHEFAHQLDGEVGPTDGAPRLEKGSMYLAWARVLGGEYERLVARIQRHQPTFLDAYAATNPAEFFAVATEVFFEKPAVLARGAPDLYETLAAYYLSDPAKLGGAEEETSPSTDEATKRSSRRKHGRRRRRKH